MNADLLYARVGGGSDVGQILSLIVRENIDREILVGQRRTVCVCVYIMCVHLHIKTHTTQPQCYYYHVLMIDADPIKIDKLQIIPIHSPMVDDVILQS